MMFQVRHGKAILCLAKAAPGDAPCKRREQSRLELLKRHSYTRRKQQTLGHFRRKDRPCLGGHMQTGPSRRFLLPN